MQQVVSSTYTAMMKVAIASGSIEGAWEYEISEHLKRLWTNPVNRPMILELLEETGASGLNAQFEKAGYLIKQSKITEQ